MSEVPSYNSTSDRTDPNHVALARNGACHQCRKRKRKCDGARPVCAPCRNPLRRTQNLVCTYDTDTPPAGPSGSGSGSSDTPYSSGVPRSGALGKRPSVYLDDGVELIKRRREALSGRKGSQQQDGLTLPIEDDSSGLGPITYTDLIWPDWPPDLPRPEVMERIFGVFFDKVPMVPAMLRRRGIMANLQLPPSHTDFPARSLLHAILAVTAPYLPSSAISLPHYQPVKLSIPSGSSPFPCTEYVPTKSALAPYGVNTEFGEWHRRKAMERLAEQAETFQKLIGTLQSHIIIAQMDLLHAKSIPFWQEAGGAVRMAVPLVLNETPNRPDNAFNRLIYLTIPKAASDMDQAERDRTWWMAWLMDRQVSTPGNWPTVMSDEEVTVELPVTQINYETGIGDLTGSQTLHSDDLFSHHPPHHSDGFVLTVKAMKLQGNIVHFFRQYARGAHSFELYTSHPRVASIRFQIASFRNSFPLHLRAPKPGGTFDPDILAAIWLIHCADVILGEPVIGDDWKCDLARHALAGIRGALSLLYDVLATSYEITMLSQICLSQWFTCGRVLCRFIEAATQAGDLAAISVFSKEVYVFRTAIEQYSKRHLLAVRQLKRLDALLDAQKDAIDLPPNFAWDCAQEMADPKHKAFLLNTPTAPTTSGDESSQATPDWASAWVHSSSFSFDADQPAIVDGVENGGVQLGYTPIVDEDGQLKKDQCVEEYM